MSSIELMARYLAERSRPIIVALALLLAATGVLVGPSPAPPPVRFVWSAAQAFLLVLAFRVWDDLADRRRDAIRHPERIMVLSRRTAPFVMLGLVLAAAALVPAAAATDASRRVAALAIVVGGLAVWYRVRRLRFDAVVGGHLILLKYPAIAFTVAPSALVLDTRASVLRAAATLVALYLVVCIYEMFDDPALRASARARRVALTELVLLIPLIIATASLQGVGLP